MEASCRLNVNLFMNKNYSLIAGRTITIITSKQEDVIECSENNMEILNKNYMYLYLHIFINHLLKSQYNYYMIH